MRWFWIDRFERFVAGQEAVGVKNVTLAEEPLDDYLPGIPHYPHSLIIEGMAQTGGILVAQTTDFQAKVVLAKVSRAEFETIAHPSDQLRLTARILSQQSDGAIVDGTLEINGEKRGELALTFAILDDSYGKESFFIPSDFCRILRSLRLFEVGVTQDGRPIKPPEYMLRAEQEELGVQVR